MKKILPLVLLVLCVAGLMAKANFKPDMRLFMHYNYGLDSKKHLYALERSYLGLKATIDNVTFRTTLDFKYDSDLNVKNVYVQYTYAEVKDLVPMSKLIFGQQKTGLIDFEGKIWGHRSVSRVGIDLYKMDTSADVGLAIESKLPNKPGGLQPALQEKNASLF